MKKLRFDRKLRLQPEIVRHLKQLTVQDLDHVQGGSGTCSGQDVRCTSTKQDGGGGP
jgi:hypothetical protein